MMIGYKPCLVFVFGMYVCLVVVFHTKLQGNLISVNTDAQAQYVQATTKSRTDRDSDDVSFRFRDLMTNGQRKLKDEKLMSLKTHAPSDRSTGSDGGQVAQEPPVFNQTQPNSSQSRERSQGQFDRHLLERLTASEKLLFDADINRTAHQEKWTADVDNIVFPSNPGCKHSKSRGNYFRALGEGYLYSAYLDYRNTSPVIHVLGLLHKTRHPPMSCLLQTSPGEYGVIKARQYQLCENHNKEYGGWMLSCDVPDNVITPICDVIIVLDDDNSTSVDRVLLPIFSSNPVTSRQDFAVCVPPLFGHIPSTTLVEFIELTQILGAKHFTFYIHRITKELGKVLQYYGRLGLVSVINWGIPVDERDVWYHGQLLAINDCLYRNMHAFEYLAFNDIDEFIIPHLAASWSGMLKKLLTTTRASVTSREESASVSGFVFYSAFFDPLLMEPSGTSRILYDLESDLRTKQFSKVRTKVMVDPVRIFELGIHHISKPIREGFEPVVVDPSDAFLHHYRKCITEFDPQMNCQIFSYDDAMSRYTPSLRHNVHHTLWILKEIEQYNYNKQDASSFL